MGWSDAYEKIKKYCNSWFYNYTTSFRFVELFFSIGFLGLKRKNKTIFKETGKETNAKLPIESDTHFVIHPTYQPALNLRPILIQQLSSDTHIKNEGLLEDLPDNYRLDSYKEELKDTLEKLQKLPLGHPGASDFEELVGKIIQLCFFRSLSNVQPKCRTVEGAIIRDWVASNRAQAGFWNMIQNKYGATQIIWECKNYDTLKSDDFRHYVAPAQNIFSL